MSAIFTLSDLEALSRPHVARAWFVYLDLPSGPARLHSGAGTLSLSGHDWRGVSDPLAGVLVSIGKVEEPVFGQATAVTLSLSGANIEFVKSVHATARQIEGRLAEIYWAAFDQETQECIIPLRTLFGRGRMTSPSIQASGIGTRMVSVTIESIWSSQNFAPGGMWNGAGQRERYPGDKGLDFVGVNVSENWA